MANETTQPNDAGKQVSLDEASKIHSDKQAQQDVNSPYVKISDHETVKMPFTGIIIARSSSGTDDKGKAWNAEKFDFQLGVKTPDGKDKIWSIGQSNKIVPQLIEILKKGAATIAVHREGTGTSTKYSISQERAL